MTNRTRTGWSCLLLRPAVGRAIPRACTRAGPITCSPAQSLALALAFALTFTLTLAFAFARASWTAVGAHTTVLFQARALTRGAFLRGFRRAAVTLAITRAVAGEG